MSTEIIQKPLTAAYQEPQPSRETHHNAHQPCVRSRLTARLHPRTSIVIAQTQSYFLSNWPFQSEDAREAFKTSDVLSFGCFVASSALDDRIALSCSLFASLFLIDDLIDTSGGRSDARHLFRAFPGLIVGDPNVQPVSKLEKVVSELFSKIRETGEQGHGFCVDTLAWFKATMGEDRDKCQKTSIEEYLKYRIIDAGYWLTLSNVRWSMGLEVPRDIPDINELERIAGYHASLVNDLYSYRREAEGRKSGEAAPSIVNAVDLVMSQNHISEAEAQHLLEDYVVQLEVEFEEIAAKCRHPLIDRYAPVLRGLMAGNLSWSMICGRYNK